MKYLLDTNVISEMYKPQYNPNVKAFIDSTPLEKFYVSAITIGELCYGIERLPMSKKKHELSVCLYSKTMEMFKNRIISIDSELALEWGKMRARAKRTLPGLDSQIAATALLHNMILVTRNTKDFNGIEGIDLLNPWE